MPRFKVFAGNYLLLEVEASNKAEVYEKVCEYNGISIFEVNEAEEDRQYRLWRKEDIAR